MPSHPKPMKAPSPPPWLQDFFDASKDFFLDTVWPSFKSIDYQTPVLSIFVAFVGAFAGGYASWIISRRYNQRDSNENQILIANSCKSIVYSIIESLLALKEQNTRPIIQKYYFDRSRFLMHRRLRHYKLIQPHLPFEYDKEFNTFIVPPLDRAITELKSKIFSELNISGRPLVLANRIDEIFSLFIRCVTLRENLLEKIPSMNDDSAAKFYFSVPISEKIVDTRYLQTLDGIENYLDDTIQFCLFLDDELRDHWRLHVEKFGIKERKRFKMHEMKFDKAAEKGLLPDSSKYKDWTDKRLYGEARE